MLNLLDKMIIIPIIAAFAYGLMRQIQETRTISRSKKNHTKLLTWSKVCSVAYSVFLFSFILNVTIAFIGLDSTIVTSENTGNLCFIALAVFFISKYGVIDKI